MMTSEQHTVKDSVLERIRGGNLSRHSKRYFTLLWAFRIFAVSLVGAVSAWVVSFIIFGAYVSGEHHLLTFGWRGIVTFFEVLPWGVIALGLVFLGIFEYGVRYFKFGYRTPLLYLFGCVFVVSAVFAAVIDTTPAHAFLLRLAARRALPVVGRYYEEIREPHIGQGVFRGIVTAATSSAFVIQHNDYDHDEDDVPYTVHPIPSCTGECSPEIGESVIVGGDQEEGAEMINAYGVARWK